jgi:hypothetical protein
MTAAWPISTVNANALRDSYTQKPERNVIQFNTEGGNQPKERRRFSQKTKIVKFTWKGTPAEHALLESFYSEDLLDGVLPFTFPNPYTGTTDTYKFTDAPELLRVRALRVEVSIALRKQP